MNRRSFMSIGLTTTLVGCGGGDIVSTDPLEVKFHRDAMNLVGGTPGYVKASQWVTTVAGINDLYYEWNSVAILANYADQGENAAHYTQANVRGKGATWAGVSEICDENWNKAHATPMVAHEFDVWGRNKNPNSVGVHIVVGDSAQIRGVGVSETVVVEDAIRVSSNHSNSKFRHAINITEVVDYLLRIPHEMVKDGRIPVRVGDNVMYLRLEV